MSRARWLVLLEVDEGGATERLELTTDDRDLRVAEKRASSQRNPSTYGTAMLWAAAVRTGATKTTFEVWEQQQISARMVEQLDDGFGPETPDPTDPASGGI